ncbi:MAG: hypothetical protein ACXW4B_11385 [Micavibrio sp.]
MVAPIILGLGALALRAAPYVARALPAIGRAVGWTAKQAVVQPIKNPLMSAAAVGGAHYVTDGASTRLALGAGEKLAAGIGMVVGPETVAAAGQTALDASGKVVQGLAGAGNTVVQRYGPDVVSQLPPMGRLGVVTGAMREGANDLVEQGNIRVPDALRPSENFRRGAEETADNLRDGAESMFGGLVNAAELQQWGNLAKQDATTNKFIMAGLALGGISGAMSGDGAGNRAFKATANAMIMALIFGAIGHYIFGQRSALIEAATGKLSNSFGNAANNNTPAPEPTRGAPVIVPQRPAPALMTPALSMG